MGRLDDIVARVINQQPWFNRRHNPGIKRTSSSTWNEHTENIVTCCRVSLCALRGVALPIVNITYILTALFIAYVYICIIVFIYIVLDNCRLHNWMSKQTYSHTNRVTTKHGPFYIDKSPGDTTYYGHENYTPIEYRLLRQLHTNTWTI